MTLAQILMQDLDRPLPAKSIVIFTLAQFLDVLGPDRQPEDADKFMDWWEEQTGDTGQLAIETNGKGGFRVLKEDEYCPGTGPTSHH